MELFLKPSHAKVKDYYNALNQFGQLNISHETAVRQAFASLLDDCARKFKWKLVQEFRLPAPKNKSIIVDGVVWILLLSSTASGKPKTFKTIWTAMA
jgi:hypothetical protein